MKGDPHKKAKRTQALVIYLAIIGMLGLFFGLLSFIKFLADRFSP